MLAFRGLIALVPSFAWRYLAIAGVLGSVYLFIDTRAANRERRKCTAAAELAQRMANQQDVDAANNARQNDQKTIDALTQQKSTDDAELERLKEQLAKRPAAARCSLTGPDARSLRY